MTTREIAHPDHSIVVTDGTGLVIGYTDHGPHGWSASWHVHGGGHCWADTPERAAVVLRNALAEENRHA